MRKTKLFLVTAMACCLLAWPGQTARAEEEAESAALESEGIPLPNGSEEQEMHAEARADLYQMGALETESSGSMAYSLRTEEMEGQIYQSLSQISPELDVSAWGFTTAQVDEFTVMFEHVVNGHPELFYVSNGYQYRFKESSGEIVAAVWEYREDDPGRIMAMKEAMEAKASEILAKTDSSMTAVEKLMVVHEALVVNTTYTKATEWENGSGCYTAYCAIVEGKALCQGYALAFDLLAERLGIRTEFVGSTSLDHAWNLVILDGENYHVDCTWDDRDRPGEVLHQNFLLSDVGIRSTGHSVWNDPGLSGGGTVYDDYYWRDSAYNYEFIRSGSVWYQIGRQGAPSGEWRRIGVSLLNPEPLSPAPVEKETPPMSVTYQSHVQSTGWQKEVSGGQTSGTMHQAKRLEAVKIKVSGNPSVGVAYQAHVQSYGWQKEVSNGALAGTENQAKRMEAIRIWLTGTQAEDYDIYYRAYVQTYGWLGWAKNGESAGTEGLAKRMEAIEIKIVERGAKAPGNEENAFMKAQPAVNYQTHVQTYGWQSQVANGALAGTTGLAKRMEAIQINVSNLSVSGGIRYQAHVQSDGWQTWKADGALAGTTNRAKRLEAIRIELTGEAAAQYDVFYRVHVQSGGWQGWVKNGELAGSVGKAKRLEAIEIRLEKKN